MTTSGGPAFKDAFVTAAETIWAGTDVQVAFGHPGMNMQDDLVVFGAMTSEQNPATMGQRSREEILTIEVVVSVFRGGGPEMEKVTSDRAYALLAQLENHARVTDTTIGGSVRHCFLSSYTSTGVTDPNVLSAGRETDITAQFVAAVRIT